MSQKEPVPGTKQESVQDMIDPVIHPDGPPKKIDDKPVLPAPKPAEQDQDAGGGYNPDHTIPQP